MTDAVSLDQLKKIMPDGLPSKLATFLTPLNQAMFEFGICSEDRIEMFLANIAEESGDLSRLSENLNYSAVGLIKTFKKKRFPSLEFANRYARKPIAIANYVYANRMGNGNEVSGDGWRYRGAGLIQLTGKWNQQACAKYFGIPVETVGDWLRTPEGACRSAAWFWHRAGCNQAADEGDFDKVCDLINIGRHTEAEGDAIGFKHRFENWKDAKEAI